MHESGAMHITQYRVGDSWEEIFDSPLFFWINWWFCVPNMSHSDSLWFINSSFIFYVWKSQIHDEEFSHKTHVLASLSSRIFNSQGPTIPNLLLLLEFFILFFPLHSWISIILLFDYELSITLFSRPYFMSFQFSTAFHYLFPKRSVLIVPL